jgi:hypothetical protein
MCGTSSGHGRDGKLINILGVDGSIILKCVRMWTEFNGSVYGPVVGSCEHNVHSFSIKDRIS